MAGMTSAVLNFLRSLRPATQGETNAHANRFTDAALLRHKREGLDLAVRARWVALLVIAVLLPFLNPRPEVLYYEAVLVLLAINGWVLRRVGQVGRSGVELSVIFFDIALMVFAMVVPNPFGTIGWPTAMGYRFENFIYLFVILTGGTLAFSWRTIMAIGNWTALLWLIGVGWVWWFGTVLPEMSTAIHAALDPHYRLIAVLDPNSLNFDTRVQEMVVFLICTYTLALSVRRFDRLLVNNATLERERANLSRYFSPNVVDELSHNDEPLKQIRTQGVAVLFIDIVGFTKYAATRSPETIIRMLREFHALMEVEIFRHGGTLDKYLGDGLMATFGSPVAGKTDALNAMRCTRAMITAIEVWNAKRVAMGEPVIQASFGLHFGPVVLGDIGVNRLEFAVIGNTVNVASRLEAMTRQMGVRLVASDDLLRQIAAETPDAKDALQGLRKEPAQDIRSLDKQVVVWTLA